jgi:hypothetical protein
MNTDRHGEVKPVFRKRKMILNGFKDLNGIRYTDDGRRIYGFSGPWPLAPGPYSTVTLFAKLRGLSTSWPFKRAI